MTRIDRLASCALPLVLALAAPPGAAQDLQDRRAAAPPPPPTQAPPTDPDQVQFSAATLEYDSDADVVTATGDVRMFREGNRLRADKVVWNRTTGKVLATGNIAVTNPQGDIAYGDSIDLTDSLKDGVVQNMLIVLERGGRIAADSGTRDENGVVVLNDAAYTPCPVTGSDNCPKEPTWKVTAVKVTYRPDRQRIYYEGARLHLFGLPSLPLPKLSNHVGGGSGSGFLSPSIGYNHTNGADLATPYYFRLAPNQGLTITPYVYTSVLPMIEGSYSALTSKGAFRLTAYATESRRSDDLDMATPLDTEMAFRGYIDGTARFQLSPQWSVSGSLRVATDRTFLRRYDISRDDILRNTVSVERIDANSYLSITGWAVQTLRVGDRQGLQPIALPEIDYRRLFDDPVLGGRVEAQVNTLAITRTAGEDTQRAFASLEWNLRKITPWGQQVTFTAYARGDLYHVNDAVEESVASYRGADGIHGRAIGALAVDASWPFVGLVGSGTQRIAPRVQLVASPPVNNLDIPNEDARAVDLEDSNLFALNRFPGYDRWEDASRATYGLDYSLALEGFSIDANVGQSYRLSQRPTILPVGTGLSGRFSDIVGRAVVRYHDVVSVTFRYRLDKETLAFRRNETDATIGSRSTYLLLGYLNLNRNITPLLEDLRDREELRVGARVQFAHYWSVFGSSIIDLTDRNEDPLSLADGFEPIQHLAGVAYEDECLKLGLTWKRDYERTGDAKRGSSFLLSLSFKNLGR